MICRQSLINCWCRSSFLVGTWAHSCQSLPWELGVPSRILPKPLLPPRKGNAPPFLSVQRPDLTTEDDLVGEPAEVDAATHFPFLIVFLPSRGSRTGSTVSPMFSMSKVSPSEMACSMTSR